MALAELGREAFQQPDLLVGELDLALGGGLFQAQQALVLGEESAPHPHAAHAAGRDLDALQSQLLLDARRAVAGMGERVIEDGRLDLRGDAIGMRALGTGQPIDQAVGAVGLEVAADLVELLARVAHQLAGLGDVVEVARQLEQRELAPCYFVGGRGHVVCLRGRVMSQQHHLTSTGSGTATAQRP